MSEILSREHFMEELANLTPDTILAHDAALRSALAEATRDSHLADWQNAVVVLGETIAERDAALARAESAEARLAEATRFIEAVEIATHDSGIGPAAAANNLARAFLARLSAPTPEEPPNV